MYTKENLGQELFIREKLFEEKLYLAVFVVWIQEKDIVT